MVEKQDEFDIIASILDLQPTSDPNEFRCLCPLHAETHPSFYINRQKRVFYCFGCGEGGTLSRLLKLLKVEPEKIQVTDRSVSEVLSRAQAFFRDQLRANYALVSQSLGERRIRFIDRFGLGYAPADKTELRKALADFADELLIKSGLFSQSLYPVLLNRITIPIRDENGTIIGFAGRAIEPTMQPKYLNTRNLPRRLTLYGVDKAYSLLKLQPTGEQRIYIVEGYFDAMHLLYNQIPAVAICGTALTYAQVVKIIGLLSRARKLQAEIRIALDPDEAGMRAAINAALMLEVFKLRIRITLLPDGRDIDEIDPIRLQRMPAFSIPFAIVEIVKKLRPKAPEVARILQQVDNKTRRIIWALLKRNERIVGGAYLQAIHNESMRLPKPKQSTNQRVSLGLFEMALAAAINGSLDLTSLPVDLSEILPEHLKPIYECVIGSREVNQLNDKEQRLYAQMSLLRPVIDGDAIRRAVEKRYWKMVAASAIQQAKQASEQELSQLAEVFWNALQRFQKLQDADDEVVDLSEFLNLL